MLKKLLAIAAFLPLVSEAQTVATFESLPLGATDSAYINYSMPNQDVGFNNGLAHFPTVYDTAFGGYWSYGFAYSRKKDSLTPTYLNQYAARTGIGYNGSSQYAVAYGSQNIVQLTGAAIGHAVRGFYITNSTYAYYTILNGNGFARKFGTHAGYPLNDYPDYFKLTVRGYSGGALKSDSVEFYLADYRYNNNANDYIVKTWEFVNLTRLGRVDSLQFSLSSSDNDPVFGMNTPAYFCMDDFSTNENDLAIDEPAQLAAKIYPNPVKDMLYVAATESLGEILLTDASGRIVYNSMPDLNTQIAIPMQDLRAGIYFLQLRAKDGRLATTRILKP